MAAVRVDVYGTDKRRTTLVRSAADSLIPLVSPFDMGSRRPPVIAVSEPQVIMALASYTHVTGLDGTTTEIQLPPPTAGLASESAAVKAVLHAAADSLRIKPNGAVQVHGPHRGPRSMTASQLDARARYLAGLHRVHMYTKRLIDYFVAASSARLVLVEADMPSHKASAVIRLGVGSAPFVGHRVVCLDMRGYPADQAAAALLSTLVELPPIAKLIAS